MSEQATTAGEREWTEEVAAAYNRVESYLQETLQWPLVLDLRLVCGMLEPHEPETREPGQWAKYCATCGKGSDQSQGIRHFPGCPDDSDRFPEETP